MNSKTRNSGFSERDLCEGFADTFGYRLKLKTLTLSHSASGRVSSRAYYIRLRYGKYSLKFFDGPLESSEKKAWKSMAKCLCDPDKYFYPGNFRGWRHFGKLSSMSELALRIAATGTR